MQIRSTQAQSYSQVLNGLRLNTFELARAQEQIATGRRLLRPSDDAVGSALSLSIRSRLNDVERMLGTLDVGRRELEASTATLEQAGTTLSEARATVVQGLNGTLGDADRRVLASRIGELRDQLVELANARSGDTYLFAGTRTGSPPYQATPDGVRYQGDAGRRTVAVGFGSELVTNLSGAELFGRQEPSGASLTDRTGVRLGTTANQGTGFAELELRHDATTGALGAGLALVDGGARDTFLGDRTLVVDGTAGTLQLGGGPVVDLASLPTPATDVVVTDEHGAELHLDLSGYTGGDLTTTLTGEGSIALGDAGFVPLTLTETDLRLVDPTTGAVLHVDATAVRRAGTDVVTYGGATDAFAVLDAIEADLENADGRPADEVAARLAARLDELDRHHANVLGGLGTLGARLERLDDSGDRLEGLALHLEGRRSDLEDADVATVVLDLSRAEQTLQLAQATGARLIQNTLLNYLR